MLDDAAKAAYKRRITELRQELEEAKGNNDIEGASNAENEIDALTRELTRAVGLGGRSRRAASTAERARVSVTRAIKDALRKISENNGEMGQLLITSIHTGNFCSYDPDQRVRLFWKL